MSPRDCGPLAATPAPTPAAGLARPKTCDPGDHPAGMKRPRSGSLDSRPMKGRATRSRPRRALVVLVAVAAWIALPAGPAAAFGTVDGGGQHREHERLTRA